MSLIMSDPMLYKLLKMYTASERKCLRGLDYFLYNGGVAFDDIEKLIEVISKRGNVDDVWIEQAKQDFWD